MISCLTRIICIHSQPNHQREREGGKKKTVHFTKTLKTTTPISLENFLYLSCFSDDFAAKLLWVCWSRQSSIEVLFTHICSARVFLCEYSTRHLSIFEKNKKPQKKKQRYAKDKLIFSEKSTTLRLSCISSSRGGIEEHVRYAFSLGTECRFKSIICNTHLHNRSSEKVVLPWWLHVFPVSLSVASTPWHSDFSLSHTHKRTLFFCWAPKYSGSVGAR